MRHLNMSVILELAQQGKIYLLSANPGLFGTFCWLLLQKVFIFLSLGFFS